MPESSTLFRPLDRERLRWIESWARGWRSALTLRFPASKGYYAELPLDVAVAMVEELAVALKDTRWAMKLLAEETMESGLEIGEEIERLRAPLPTADEIQGILKPREVST